MAPSEIKPDLLLLPPLPANSPYLTIKRVYTPLPPPPSSLPAELDIALPLPHLTLDSNRAPLFTRTQRALANIYKLIAAVAAAHSIPLAGANALDVRVLILAYPFTFPAWPYKQIGPTYSLEALVLGRWGNLIAVPSPRGAALRDEFLKLRDDWFKWEGAPKIKVISADTDEGPEPNEPGPEPADEPVEAGDDPVRTVVVGGTFDHLHLGHKLLLTMTAFALDSWGFDELDLSGNNEKARMVIGLTAAAQLASKKYAEYLEPWDQRYRAVHGFLEAILRVAYVGPTRDQGRISETWDEGPNGHVVKVDIPRQCMRIEYVEIWDPFGPTITEPEMDALVLSAETRAGGKMVNDKRVEKGWKPLKVLEVDVLDAEEGEGGGAFEMRLGLEDHG
ncbi:hypothetical protein EJ06DRAFT_519787 [Trichodelitschia bisporula]|uniref:Cytidyltransferase-like domain-containing protein n=1 Tax=Trichodelitschia bisporula TaxID=703511 RepID=A0A6G1I3C2_9PEZI|nr:hypothetical protein EJ06DRAFT_519787 [Trichodelitschia bisporula]